MAPQDTIRTGEHLAGGFAYERAGMAEKAIRAYEAALATGGTLEEQARAQLSVARVHGRLAEWDAAFGAAREAERLAAQIPDDDLRAEAMNVRVGLHTLRDEFDAAEATALDALDIARSPRIRGMLQQNRGTVAAKRGEFPKADALFAESAAAFETAGYELGRAIALNNRAAAARDMGDPARSLEVAAVAAALARELEALEIVSLAVQNQAHALAQLGRPSEAEALMGEAFGHFTTSRNIVRQAECLEILGLMNATRPEDRETARKAFELAATLARRAGATALASRLQARAATLTPDAPTSGASS